jgi:hypothetical protein
MGFAWYVWPCCDMKQVRIRRQSRIIPRHLFPHLPEAVLLANAASNFITQQYSTHWRIAANQYQQRSLQRVPSCDLPSGKALRDGLNIRVHAIPKGFPGMQCPHTFAMGHMSEYMLSTQGKSYVPCHSSPHPR